MMTLNEYNAIVKDLMHSFYCLTDEVAEFIEDNGCVTEILQYSTPEELDGWKHYYDKKPSETLQAWAAMIHRVENTSPDAPRGYNID